MNELKIPGFKSYEEEAAFWDSLDTADFMEDDGEWFRFDTPHRRAVRLAKGLDCRDTLDDPWAVNVHKGDS